MPYFRLKSPRQIRLTENDIEQQCLDVLRYRGYYIQRQHVGKYRTLDGKRIITAAPEGEPDYTATHGIHRAFLLEIKAPGKKTSPKQDQRIFEIKLGYQLNIAVVDSLSALLDFLQQHETNTK